MNPLASKRRSVGAGATGASTGTGVIYLAKYLSKDYPAFSEFLTYAAPTISVISGTVAFIVVKKCKDWYLSRQVASAEKRFKEVSEQALSNTNISNDVRAEILKNVEEVQRSAVARAAKNVKNLHDQELKANATENYS